MKFSNGHALVIGVANYPHVNPLPEAVLKDARDVGAMIQSEQCGYEPENVRLLIDSDATADAIRNELGNLSEKAQTDDTVFIFFSGHGGESDSGAEADNYLIPFDCNPRNLAETAIAGSELTDFFRQIQSERLLVVFDCCYAGGTANPKNALFSPQNAFLKSYSEQTYDQLAQGKGRVIIASSRPDQVSLLLSGMNNSLFTHYLLEAFRGETRTRADGLIRVFDLFDYVSEKVPAQATQNPIFKTADFENNFPVALWRGGEKAIIGTEATRRMLYNIGKIRELIRSALTENDMREICDLHFESISDDFKSQGLTLSQRIDILVDFVKRGNTRIETLLAAIKKENSEKFNEFEPYLQKIGEL